MVFSAINGSITVTGIALVLPLLFVAVFLYLKRSKYASNTREVSSPPVSQTVQSGTDVSLLQRISQQDDSALSELYDRHASLLYALILRILKDEHYAEDILQEVFLRIWDRAQTYDEALGSPTAWLTRVARNMAIDRLRSKVSRARDREDLLDEDREFQDVDQESSPERATIQAQQHQVIVAALSSLPREQRVLIEYAYFKGFTQSELAEHFKLPLGTVKTRIRAGMSALRLRLQHLT